MRISTMLNERTTRIARWTTGLFAIFVLANLMSFSVFAQGVTPVRSEVEGQQDGALRKEVVPEVPDRLTHALAPLAATPNSANYAFTNATNGTFTDMTGAASLMPGGQDDVASPVTPIGFDFYFMGQRFDSFTLSSNGIIRLGTTAIGTTTYAIAQAGQSLIAAAGSDMVMCSLAAPALQGRIVYKVIGAAPNRTLVIEFRNVSIIFPVAPVTSTADGTYQVRLAESTGQIELLYGAMFRNGSLGFSGGNQPINIGFSSGNTDGTYATVASATGVVTTTGAPTSNLYTLATNIANLNSPVEGSRRVYTFLPPAPTAATGLNFTGVTQTTTTLNWTDSPNEVGYGIYRSTDGGATFTFVATVAGDAVTFPATGLLPGTNYTWRVAAFNEGRLSNLDGAQLTSAAGTKNSGSGLWSDTATWGGNPIPTATDDVLILTGQTVTIDVAAVANKVGVQSGATLQYDSTIVSSLTVTQNVTIDSGGTLQSNPAGTVTTHALTVGTDLTNNGTLDFSTNGNTAAAGITFTGATNNTFGGTGATTDIRTLTVNKGTSNANILELNPTNFTVQGVTTDVAGFLTLTNGTFKISGSFTGTNRVFTTAAYAIGATTGIWLNNTNYTIAGQAGSPTNNGLLRLSLGTYNMGTIAGNAMAGGTGSMFIIEGGTFNASGRLLVAGASATYTQTGGTVNATTVGNASSATAGFGFTSATSLVTFGGGTINLVNRATGATILDYNVASLPGTLALTVLNIGTAATATNFNFAIQGNAPIVNIDNTANNKILNLNGTTRVFGNLTIPVGTTLNCANAAAATGNIMVMYGATVSNNGTITGLLAGSRFDFQGALAQTYGGSGVFGTAGTPFAGVGVSTANSNPASVTLSSPIFAFRINMFFGDIHNANQITLGTGGTSTTVVQIGQAGNATTGGSFDVSPTHNQGTGVGGEIILYLQETAPRTTGFEVNPTRTLLSTTVDNTSNVTIAGGDIAISNTAVAATMTNGRIITGANTLALSSGTATITRTNGYVDGNFRKNYSAAASKLFEVGTANGFSPVTVNATSGTFPANFTAKAVQGPQPSVNAATSIQRYWTLTGSGITADLTFQYLVGDVLGTEANYKVIRVIGTTPVAFPTSVVTPATHVATLAGVSVFSDWTVGEISAPTAAPATISGQVTTTSGAPLAGVTMYLSGARSGRTITDGNGNYRFTNVATENFYTVTAARVNYHFSPASRSFSLLGNMTEATFTGALDSVITGNVIDSPEYFVRQHYLDFLGREPDDAGLNFWSDQMRSCGNDFNCLERRTINVSAAYFLSIEFQKTGGLVDGLYRASYGRAPLFGEFMPDTATVAHNVVVGDPDWEGVLTRNTAEFLDAWVERAAFRAAYDNLTNDGFVAALLGNTRVSFTDDERAALVGGLNNATLTRAQVLQRVAQNEHFVSAKFNEAFVRMQYFGYLRRDPDDSGFHFWLNKLNEFDGNFERAEMVKAFLVSGEYRDRFRQ